MLIFLTFLIINWTLYFKTESLIIINDLLIILLLFIYCLCLRSMLKVNF